MAFNWIKFPWTNLHELNLDWIIQTVKTLEGNLADAISSFREMIDTAISNTLTGSGDLTINKTGDVNITGNNVRVTSGGHAQITGGAVISDTSEQLTLHNPNSKKRMTANYNSGVLTLTNNQDLAAGVAVYPINTPADGGGDNSTFAANVGYVKTAVGAVSTALATETENRTSGDAALQSTIDNVIMPILNARKVHDFHVTATNEQQDGYLLGVDFTDGYPKSDLDNLIAQNAEIRLVVETPGATQYFNICRPWGNSYIGFSGMIQLASGVASQIIGYNGTNFTVYGDKTT